LLRCRDCAYVCLSFGEIIYRCLRRLGSRVG
jgi:hypothetical protein